MSESRPGGTGLLVSLRGLVATALELAQVRLELLGTELEQQKLRLAAGLVWAMLGVVLFGVGLVMLAGCVLLLFWEGYRLQAMVGLTVVFVAAGGLSLRHGLARLKTPPGAFALSTSELARDRSALAPEAEVRLP